MLSPINLDAFGVVKIVTWFLLNRNFQILFILGIGRKLFLLFRLKSIGFYVKLAEIFFIVRNQASSFLLSILSWLCATRLNCHFPLVWLKIQLKVVQMMTKIAKIVQILTSDWLCWNFMLYSHDWNPGQNSALSLCCTSTRLALFINVFFTIAKILFDIFMLTRSPRTSSTRTVTDA